MRLRLFLLLSILWLVGCPNPKRVLIGEYGLSDSIKAIVPYADGNVIKLASETGQELIFSVKHTSGWAEQEDFYCGMSSSREISYIRYEYDSTILTCNYPKIRIVMDLRPGDLYGVEGGMLYIQLNYDYEIAFLHNGQDFVPHQNVLLADSVNFNGKIFYNVVYGDLFSAYMNDTNAIYFKTLYYNAQCGIVNLKMSDDEEFICVE